MPVVEPGRIPVYTRPGTHLYITLGTPCILPGIAGVVQGARDTAVSMPEFTLIVTGFPFTINVKLLSIIIGPLLVHY